MNRHSHLIENSVVNNKKRTVTKATSLSKYQLLKQGATLGDHAQKGSELSMKVSRKYQLCILFYVFIALYVESDRIFSRVVYLFGTVF